MTEQPYLPSSPKIGRVKKILCTGLDRWAIAGLFLYLAAFYFLDSSGQKTLFYLLVGIPGLLLVPRLLELYRLKSVELITLGAFLIYMSATSLWSGTSTIDDALKYSMYLMCLLLVIDAAARQDITVDHVLNWLLVVGAAAAVVYAIALFGRLDNSANLALGRFSFEKMAGWGDDNPISSAIVLGLTVLIAWWRFPVSARGKQVLLVILMLLCFVMILLTKSRGPLVALGGVLALMSLYRRAREDLVLWASLIFFAAVGLVLFDLAGPLAERFAQPNYRMDIWSAAFSQIESDILIGQGFGRDADIMIRPGVVVTHSHSSFIEIVRVGGLLGGALAVALLWAVFVRRDALPAATGIFIFWFVFGIGCLSTNGRLPLIRPTIEWFAFWLPLLLTLRFSPQRFILNSRE
ncbi:O-antigen ligase family protein [Stutzerimonas chloritidismutans]|uniref:O-antigen ligase family protein n=1 Tax=Stutzerimonas chloritidismutans TaxID=203192 RepID=UPI003F185E34